MKDAINMILNLSFWLKIFAFTLSMSVLFFMAGLLSGYINWYICSGLFVLIGQTCLLFDHVEDRRICSDEEREEWSLKNQI